MDIQNLKEYRRLMDEIEDRQQTIDEIEAVITSPARPSLEGMPSGGAVKDRSEIIIKYITLKEEVDDRIQKVMAMLSQIEEELSKLPADESNVLRKTYIQGLTNAEIAAKINCSTRTVQRIRARAEELLTQD